MSGPGAGPKQAGAFLGFNRHAAHGPSEEKLGFALGGTCFGHAARFGMDRGPDRGSSSACRFPQKSSVGAIDIAHFFLCVLPQVTSVAATNKFSVLHFIHERFGVLQNFRI